MVHPPQPTLGDAMIVLWPPDKTEDINMRLRRAAQCAVQIQQTLHEATLENGVTLSVKVGIGYGTASVLHIGGTHARMEYIAVGEALIQAFAAVHTPRLVCQSLP